VRSKFGLHIIKVESKTAPVTRSVDDAAKEIAREILTEDKAKALAKAEAEAWQKKLAETEDPESLNPVDPKDAKEAKVDPFAPKVESTGLFERGQRYIPKVGAAPEIGAVAFTLTKEAPSPGALIETGGRYYAIKLKDRQIPDPTTFDSDKERLRTELISRRQMRAVDDYVKDLRSKAVVKVDPGYGATRNDDPFSDY
jgi:peptidyl-prolyl cis-trans isomerase D